jgi:hypothetical protein
MEARGDHHCRGGKQDDEEWILINSHLRDKEDGDPASDMQMLRQTIEDTEVPVPDTDGQEDRDDSAAIRLKLKPAHHDQIRHSTHTLHTSVDGCEVLQLGGAGNDIHDRHLVKVKDIKRSPEYLIARRAYHCGLACACSLWIVASHLASDFGVWATYTKWAIIILGIIYLAKRDKSFLISGIK